MSSAPAPAAQIDDAALARRIEEICRVMSAHAGAIELVEVSAAGAVRVRFTGMCAGCMFRPLTMRGTIAPALEEIPGVSAVHADGARISEESAARLARYMDPPLWAEGSANGSVPL
jgi:Fe-S cluster biogenesis protein NfuA